MMRLLAATLAALIAAGPLFAQTAPAPAVPGQDAAPPAPVQQMPTVQSPAPPQRGNLNSALAPLVPGSPPANASPPTNANPQAPPNPQQRRAEMEHRFDAANTTRDGRLTLAQARAAQLMPVVRNFQAIDRGNKGYVTKADVEAYMRARRSQQHPPN